MLCTSRKRLIDFLGSMNRQIQSPEAKVHNRFKMERLSGQTTCTRQQQQVGIPLSCLDQFSDKSLKSSWYQLHYAIIRTGTNVTCSKAATGYTVVHQNDHERQNLNNRSGEEVCDWSNYRNSPHVQVPFCAQHMNHFLPVGNRKEIYSVPSYQKAMHRDSNACRNLDLRQVTNFIT